MKNDKGIIHFYSHTRPGGGPPGYLFNIDSLDSNIIKVVVEHTAAGRTSTANNSYKNGLISVYS